MAHLRRPQGSERRRSFAAAAKMQKRKLI